MQKKLFLNIAPLIAILILSGCASGPKAPQDNPEITQMLEKETGTLDQKLIAKIMAEPPKLKTKSQKKVEGEINKRIRWWMHYYSVRDRERFQRILERGESYRGLVQQLLRESKLPSELYYLAMIESGFVNHATSAANAVGIWQFERPTALNYGLEVKGAMDERKHPISATVAAAKYLNFLHHKFNSWHLAIAAYNCGQGRINQAIREGGSEDFWALAEGGFLPKETMDYIPKFLAAATIGSHLEQFGFQPIRAMNVWPEVAAVTLKRNAKVSQVALKAGISREELLRLNPRLISLLTHAKVKKIQAWVPRTSAQKFVEPESTVAIRDQKKSTIIE